MQTVNYQPIPFRSGKFRKAAVAGAATSAILAAGIIHKSNRIAPEEVEDKADQYIHENYSLRYEKLNINQLNEHKRELDVILSNYAKIKNSEYFKPLERVLVNIKKHVEGLISLKKIHPDANLDVNFDDIFDDIEA